MDTFFLIIFIGMIIVLGLVLSHHQTEENKKRIHAYVKRRGGTHITVHSVWGDRDEGTNTFDVSYVDADGRRHHTRCKIRASWGKNQLYWRDAIHQPQAPQPQMVSSSKQAVIDQLAAENERLRSELKKFRHLVN